MSLWKISPLKEREVSDYLALLSRFRAEESLPKSLANAQSVKQDVLTTRRRVAIHIARDPGGPIGFVSFQNFFEPSAGVLGFHLCDVYVIEAYRSRGIGKELVMSCRRAALLSSRRFIWWAARKDNLKAIRLSRAVGANISLVNSVSLMIPEP